MTSPPNNDPHLPARDGSQRLLAAFLSGRSPRTLEAYRADVEFLRVFISAPTLDAVAARLLGNGMGAANELVLRWRGTMLDEAVAPATINRRLAAVRSMVKLARTMGLVPWTLEVPGVPSTPYRDTRGPGRTGVVRLCAVLEAAAGALAVRNVAIVRLLYDLGLRRAEVAALDVADVDLDRRALAIVGKGRRETETLTLPERTAAALAAWLALRGVADPHAPLFVALDRPGRTTRLTASSIYRMVRSAGVRVGVRARPHGVRHAAITEALDLTGGDVRAVARFSRHRDVRTLQRYDDSRRDLGGDVARRLSEGL